jgi:hypothetical protein
MSLPGAPDPFFASDVSQARAPGRGAEAVHIAPKREIYIHHTVTSNHPPRAEEREHMRDLEQVQRP